MSDAALRASTFGTLVRARQARVAALSALNAAEDTCSCTGRRCTCSSVKAAERAYEAAAAAQAEREHAWREFCATF